MSEGPMRGGEPAGLDTAAQLKAALEGAADGAARTALFKTYLSQAKGPVRLAAETNSPTMLAGMVMPRARLRRADLSGANLREADLDGAFLAQSTLLEVKLERATLRGADLSHAKCAGAGFGEADLGQAMLEEADLTGATFRFSDLRGAALEAAQLTDADLWGAHLDGADLAGATLRRAALRETSAPGANFTRADLRQAVMVNTDLSGARFVQADLREVTLQEARLDGADFSAASLQDLDLSHCTLKGARWNLAKLSRTTLNQVQLGGRVGEELAGEWDAAAGAYLALERNFADLGAVDSSSWAYRRRRRMAKRATGAAGLATARQGRYLQAARLGLGYLGASVVEWSCDYGESVGRVFACLVVTFLAFIALYAVTNAISRSVDGVPAVSHRFVDLAVFSMQAMTNTQASNNELKPSYDLAVFMAGGETLISIFLTGLLGFVAGNRIRR